MSAERKNNWTFFSNHGHVFFLLSKETDITTRFIASEVGISERAVANIIKDLAESGYIKITKNGRNNSYTVYASKTLRHPLESNVKLRELLDVLSK